MSYYDEEILIIKDDLDRKSHTTLETGIYVGKQLITFSEYTLEQFKISVYLPNCFIVMPEKVRNLKYPSKDAPEMVMTSLDSTVNIAFNKLEIKIAEEEIKRVSQQFQKAIQNINPSIIIDNDKMDVTEEGFEMSWFDFRGFSMDGQSYNRMVFFKLSNCVIHMIFNCQMRDKKDWISIIGQIVKTVKERG